MSRKKRRNKRQQKSEKYIRHLAREDYLEILWAAINRPFPKNIKPPRKNLPPIFADKGLILFETITLSKIN